MATLIDLARLTVAELEELTGLAVRVHRRPDGQWDFAALDDRELARRRGLTKKARVESEDSWDGRPMIREAWRGYAEVRGNDPEPIELHYF